MPILTPADIRGSVSALANADTYPDAVITAYIAEFEELAEDYLGTAFQPREQVDTFTIGSSGAGTLVLTRTNVREVTSVTVEDVEAPAATYTVSATGGLVLYGAVGLVGKFVTVTYTHGLDEPPALLLRACKQYVRSVALADNSGVSRDVIAQSFEGMTTRYSTPDKRAGRPTGFLEVDRLLNNLPAYTAPKMAG